MNTDTAHPICAGRQRRLRIVTFWLTFDIACVIVANLTGHTIWMVTAGAAALITFPGWVWLAYSLRFRCPSRTQGVNQQERVT